MCPRKNKLLNHDLLILVSFFLRRSYFILHPHIVESMPFHFFMGHPVYKEQVTTMFIHFAPCHVFFFQGCFNAMYSRLLDYIWVLGGIGIGVAVLQVSVGAFLITHVQGWSQLPWGGGKEGRGQCPPSPWLPFFSLPVSSEVSHTLSWW